MSEIITWKASIEGTIESPSSTCIIQQTETGLAIHPGRADHRVAEVLVAGGALPSGTGYRDTDGNTPEAWAELLLTIFERVELQASDGGVQVAIRNSIRYRDTLGILEMPLAIERTTVVDGVGNAGGMLVPSLSGCRFIPVSVALPGKEKKVLHSHVLFKSTDRNGNPTLMVYNAAIGGFESLMPIESSKGILLHAAFSSWLAPGMTPLGDGPGATPGPRIRRPRTAWLETRFSEILGEKLPVLETTDVLYDSGPVTGMEGKMLRSVASVLYDLPAGNGHRCAVIDPALTGKEFRKTATEALGHLAGDTNGAGRLASAVFGPRDLTSRPGEFWDDD